MGKKQLKIKKYKTITPRMKKGDCIIWAANLLHGSPKCLNNKLYRKSQVHIGHLKVLKNIIHQLFQFQKNRSTS